MSKHRRYGRNQKRQHREQIAALHDKLTLAHAHAKSLGDYYCKCLEDERAATRMVQDRLRRLESKIRQHCTASTLLEAVEKIDRDHTRVPVREHRRMSIYDNPTPIDLYAAMPIENVMMMMLSDENCLRTLTRRLHFRIANPPSLTGSTLSLGYAVTHTELRMMHPDERGSLTRMICEQFGAAIHQNLFGRSHR